MFLVLLVLNTPAALNTNTFLSKLKTVSSAPCLYRVIENNTSGKTRLSRRRVFHSFCDFSETFTSNRFHVAVLLFSSRSHMTSKCAKDKNVAYEAIAESVTDVLTSHLQYYPNSQVFPPFYNTDKGNNFVMMTLIVRLPSSQNARINKQLSPFGAKIC